MNPGSAGWSAHRRRVADTIVLLLLFLPLLNVTSGTRNRKDVHRVLQPFSQPFLRKHLQAHASYQHPKAAEKEKSVAVFNHSGSTFIHTIAGSNSQLNLSELNVLNPNNENGDSGPQGEANVSYEQSSLLSTDPDELLRLNKNHPGSQYVNTADMQKKLFEKSANDIALTKLGEKNVFLYKPNVNSRSKRFGQVDSVEHVRLKDITVLWSILHLNSSKIQYDYSNSNSNIPKRNKRSVITLGDSETVQTVDCVNRSIINSTCGNDGRFNVVPGSGDFIRTGGNIQPNNTFSDRNRKSVKEFSSFSQSRLILPFQKKKLVDITDSGMGYRSTSASDSFQKHRPTPGNGSDASATASRSINISSSIPSVKPAGRLTAESIPQEGLDAASITGITVGSVVFLGVVGALCFILYKRRNQNKPQTLSDKSSNPDSSVYIEESSDDSEEMYSLDNDSFLNSLEAMTIQNYWTENVKHTKL